MSESETYEIVVQARKCATCRLVKPLVEFYESELKHSAHGGRCRPCMRARMQRKDRRTGRRATSFSRAEALWLQQALRKMPAAPPLHDMVKQQAYARVARKIDRMVDRPDRSEPAPDNVVPIGRAKS